VFRACIHCCKDLGHNEVVEPFPVGRRLAFDSAQGRLWVICPHCGRWNLTPLEERWEAVEECERRFRGLRLRAQTPNIGYARLREGLDLVRIGRPLRPEFAAWRYGREIKRRRNRQLLGATAALALGGLAVGGIYVSAGIILPHAAAAAIAFVHSQLGVAQRIELPRGPGRAWTVESGHTMLLTDADAGWRLSVRHHFGRTELRGDEARRWLSWLLARVNRSDGSDALVAAAVKQVEETAADSLIRKIATESDGWWSVDRAYQEEYDEKVNRGWASGDEKDRPKNRASLAEIPPARRLALEMALHETTEQRAIDGELAALEAAWREAEEIAGIADDMLLPASVTEFVERNQRHR
jgi:hypothetical protein